MWQSNLLMWHHHASRNTIKVRDWIDLVFVKRRFYSAEASHAASVSRTQVCQRSIGHCSGCPEHLSHVCLSAESMPVVCVAVHGERTLHSISRERFWPETAGQSGWQWCSSPPGTGQAFGMHENGLACLITSCDDRMLSVACSAAPGRAGGCWQGGLRGWQPH